MDGGASQQSRLDNLRRWRNRRPRDLSLAYLADHVRKTIVKPHEQLEGLAATWRELLPPALADRASMGGLSRGVLTVYAMDHATLYEVDRLLRGGGEQRLRAACKATLRRVRCCVGKPGGTEPPAPRD